MQAWLASLVGAHGEKGDAGKSAFELAVDNGYIGSEEEWLASLVGKNGLSAYEIALKHGFEGTELEWLASLKGVGITASSVNANGELELTYSDGSVVNAGKIAGTDGLDGVGISNIQLAANGELTIYMTNGTNYAVGNVKGEKGDKGDRGEKGDTGAQGLPGANGRGIANMAFNASGELVVYYTDGTYQNLGAIPSNGGSEPDEPEILSYSLLSDGTYRVSAGPDIESQTAITIPAFYKGAAVTKIADDAFNGYSHIVAVNIPDTVTYIGINAFNSCSNLSELKLSSNIVTLEANAFKNCKNLSSTITVPATCNYVGNGCFSRCSNASIVVIPDSLEYIGAGAFSSVSSLTWESTGTNSWHRTVTGTYNSYYSPSIDSSYHSSTDTFELEDATLSASTAEGRLSGTEKQAWAYYTNGGRYLSDVYYRNCVWTRDAG